MADQEHLDKLKEGVAAWNLWRKVDVSIYPDLREADLREAYLEGANLHGANLHGTYLRRARLNGADLREAYLYGADLRRAYLIEARLNGADLEGAYLIEARLNGANLSEAHLEGADLEGADLQGADLEGADLQGADLEGADLQGADLEGAYLHGANLHGANLHGAYLTNAICESTTFANIDLTTTKGLTTIEHRGRSIVDLPTVKLPQDGSATHFLRGAGIPDEWIDFYRVTMMSPIQYYSCFISYSSTDTLLASRLHADLQDHGVRCWFAPHDLKIGDKIRSRIDEAIHLQDKLLLLLSQHALASNWVEDEVEAALEKENRQQRDVLFPVRLDESIMHTSEAWAAKLRRTRHIGDFTQWKQHDEYQKAFTRLLRDLKAQA